jgi:hypothetical protein
VVALVEFTEEGVRVRLALKSELSRIAGTLGPRVVIVAIGELFVAVRAALAREGLVELPTMGRHDGRECEQAAA